MTSQMLACSTGAQNIEAREKMIDSAGMVTAAPISLRTNIDSSSYSNSGAIVEPLAKRWRAARMSSAARLRMSLWPRRLANC